MQTLTLGPEGPTVPALGIGTWSWGDRLFWSYGKDYGEPELYDAFKAALESGVNFFDTAEIYGFGESETLIGQFMHQTDQPVLVATKYLPLPWRFNADAVVDALTASLERLQVSSIPLYQVHWPFDFFMGQDTLMSALAHEVKRGRIQAVGVSNYSAEQMQTAHHLLADQGIPLAVNQVEYSLLSRKIEQNGVLETAQRLGITILAYSPLAQGLLTGKYTLETYQKPTGARWLDPRFSKSGLEKLSPLIQHLQTLGEKYQRTPAQISLNWLISQGNVIPIPGAKNAKQARQNSAALGWELNADDRAQLDEVTRSLG